MSANILFTRIFNPALTKAIKSNLTLLAAQVANKETLVADINSREPPLFSSLDKRMGPWLPVSMRGSAQLLLNQYESLADTRRPPRSAAVPHALR